MAAPMHRASDRVLLVAILPCRGRHWRSAGRPTPAAPPAATRSTLELAKKTQNPIADLISLPFQNNLNFGYGAKDAPESSSTQYVLTISR